METEQLIQKLSKELTPVKPLPAPFLRAGKWLLASLLCVFAGITLMGLRQDLGLILSSPLFIFESLLILAISALAAASAFILSVPGAEKRYSRELPLFMILAWALLLVGALALQDISLSSLNPLAHPGYNCMVSIFTLGIVPGIILFAMVRQAAPLSKAWATSLSIIAASTIGAFGLQFVCTINHPMHIIIWHFIPTIAVGGLGIVLGRHLLTWDERKKA